MTFRKEYASFISKREKVVLPLIDKVKALCYTSVYIDMEVFNLKDEQFTDDKRRIEFSGSSHGIGFLYKKIDAPKLSLTYWIDVPEFTDAITNLLDEGHTVGNNEVFHIMKKIYLEKNSRKKNGIQVDFNFSLARQSLKKLSEVLTGNKDNWKL